MQPRSEVKKVPTAPEPRKPEAPPRFQIVKLEERIAPGTISKGIDTYNQRIINNLG